MIIHGIVLVKSSQLYYSFSKDYYLAKKPPNLQFCRANFYEFRLKWKRLSISRCLKSTKYLNGYSTILKSYHNFLTEQVFAALFAFTILLRRFVNWSVFVREGCKATRWEGDGTLLLARSFYISTIWSHGNQIAIRSSPWRVWLIYVCTYFQHFYNYYKNKNYLQLYVFYNL